MAVRKLTTIISEIVLQIKIKAFTKLDNQVI
jgi:hypothetical protein